MAKIHILSQDTINKIAAGEVIERPMAVAKELIENAIDAQATAITVEIKEGGKSLVRITDNGSGMEEEDIALAFTPHATSKIEEVTDLLSVSSLGFRGEALASIAAVSQLEMVTKTREALMGVRYCADGGKEVSKENVGCPDGTTFLVRNLFYNTPARLKFLKTAQTEAGYISSLVERMALSHPDISFRFINQNQTRLSTSGNGKLKDVIYQIYGRDVSSNLIELEAGADMGETICQIRGFIGKPVVSRGNRALMNYFINGRYITSTVISRAIEEAYAPYTMQHRYPFTVLHLSVKPEYIDVNVHPQKMEIRFTDEKTVYENVLNSLSEALEHKDFIPQVTFGKEEKKKEEKAPVNRVEPFEANRLAKLREGGGSGEQQASKVVGASGSRLRSGESLALLRKIDEQSGQAEKTADQPEGMPLLLEKELKERQIPDTLQESPENSPFPVKIRSVKQETLFEEGILSNKAEKEVKIIGQIFSTYWILQYEDSMYLVDQHAAHEKVLYERLVKETLSKEAMTQLVQPPVVLTLSMAQQQAVEENKEVFARLGYQLEEFGGREYAVSGVPAHLPEVGNRELLLDVIDSLVEEQGRKRSPEILLDKLASMSCKAAVKGNSKLPMQQMEVLLKELMTLDNPYHCPHGRPTMIRMTKQELEKKFKRIL